MTYSAYSSRPLEGSYVIKLYEPDGTPITTIGETYDHQGGNVVNTFKSLHYTRAMNGMYSHGYGEFSVTLPMSEIPDGPLPLDTVINIHRKAPNASTPWREDFWGVVRYSEVTAEEDTLMYTFSGFDLKHLLKRRCILPDDGSEPYEEGWYTLVNNIGAVWGIIPKEYEEEPYWRARMYESVCYPEAYDADFSNETGTIMIAGKHGAVNETQRYLYIGCTGKFSKVRFWFGTPNTTVSATLWVQYYSNTYGWLTLEGATDGCNVGGKPMAQDGVYEFTIPDEWDKGTGVTFSGFGQIYWLRFTLEEDGDTTEVEFTLKEVEVYGTPEVDMLRWCSGNDHWTDIMRHLVRDQCITGSLVHPTWDGITVDRTIKYLSCEADTHEGTVDYGCAEEANCLLNLCYRFDNLATVLEEISGLGADWDVVQLSPGSYQFQIDYNQDNWSEDLTEDNEDGNTPVTFSLENCNVDSPVFQDDRNSEITVCFGAGKMKLTGDDGLVEGDKDGPKYPPDTAFRPIYPRLSLYDAHLASDWNWIEAVSDSTSEDNKAAVKATADSFLMDNTQKIIVSFNAKQTPDCLYGVDWDLGDMVGFYFNGRYREMRVSEVEVNVDESGEAVTPTIIKRPSLDELYPGM